MAETRLEEREGGGAGTWSLGRPEGRGASLGGLDGGEPAVPAPPKAEETRGEAGPTAGRGGSDPGGAGRGGSPGRDPCQEVFCGAPGAGLGGAGAGR